MKIVFLQATAMAMSCLSAAASKLIDSSDEAIELKAFTKEDLFDKKRIQFVAQEASTADIVVFAPHGELTSIPGYRDIRDAARGWVFIQPTNGEPDRLDEAIAESSLEDRKRYLQLASYLHHGGVDNYFNLMCLLILESRGEDASHIPPAEALPYDGIYHPDLAETPKLDDYLKWARDRNPNGKDALVVGLWFYHGYWINKESKAIDAVIHEIESQGAIALPVFHRRFPDPELNNPGAPGVVEKYFKPKGKLLIDALLSPISFSLAQYGEKMAGVYPDLGVPVFQMIPTQNPGKVWKDTIQAVTPVDVSISAAQPEFDGCLITSVYATREVGRRDPVTGATLTYQEPVLERIEKIVSLALNWARLRRIPPAERKVAIVFHHYPPRNDMIGSAFGLDSFESVNRLLAAMKDRGYGVDEIYESGEKLAFRMLERMTNDRRFLPPEKMAERALDTVDAEHVSQWNSELPEASRKKMLDTWGKAPGTILTHEGEYLIGGLSNGNVFIGLQPIRGKGETEDLMPTQTGGLIHDPDLAPPHHYLGFYRWIKEDFGAHAVMHIGKHGTLEWLPGKSLGLSEECYPDLAIQDLPNIYPYIINNPGEGTQAKRRSYCCIISHLIPPMTSADKADELKEVEDLMDTYYDIRQENPGKVPDLMVKLWEAVEAKHLHVDLDLERAASLADPEHLTEVVHGYLNEVSVTAINDGLHILGQEPEEQRMIDTLAQYLRLPNSGSESLWEVVANHMGFDDEDLRDNPGEFVASEGKTKGQIREDVVEKSKELLQALEAGEWKAESVAAAVEQVLGNSERAQGVLDFVSRELHPNLMRTHEEIDHALLALDGHYVLPGGAGAPTRGNLDILPTGRNFYSVDPQKIPTPEAWDCGIRLGDTLVQRYVDDEGKVPEQIGITIWASPTMRTRGDDIAEIFYLMGLKPVWHPSTGRVQGLEVIPLEKLKHPRMDITLRTSGLFRDAFPNLMELLDTGVEMVAALKEPEEMNFLARNVAVERKELELSGVDPEEAKNRSLARVFSCKPGAYGTGTDVLLENGEWKTGDDLGEAFMQWGAYAYRKGEYGRNCYDDFRRRLGKVQATVKNEDSREHDILIRDDWVIFQGGMNAAVNAITGKQPRSYTVDAADPRKPKARSTAEEARFIYRARILNPKWIEGCKRHGFKGAAEFSHAVDHSFEWDATSNVIDDWQYERLAETYALDPEMQQFLKEHNPYVLQNISERLLEAIERDMWEKPGEYRERLQEVLLDIEGDIEDTL